MVGIRAQRDEAESTARSREDLPEDLSRSHPIYRGVTVEVSRAQFRSATIFRMKRDADHPRDPDEQAIIETEVIRRKLRKTAQRLLRGALRMVKGHFKFTEMNE